MKKTYIGIDGTSYTKEELQRYSRQDLKRMYFTDADIDEILGVREPVEELYGIEMNDIINEVDNKEIQTNPNKRPLPLEVEFMKKKYNDLVYAYLQCNSYKGIAEDNAECYFVYKTATLITDIHKAIRGSNKKTTYNKYNKLLDGGFIIEGKVWNKEHTELVDGVILKQYDSFFEYIRIDTMRYLINTTNEFVIKVYAYLKNKVTNVNANYKFSIKELILNCLGVKSISNKRDYESIYYIMDLLECRLGLINTYDKKAVVVSNSGNQTYYWEIKNVKNTIGDCETKDKNKWLDKK